MSISTSVRVGFAILKNDDCSIAGYRLGTNPDKLLYEFVKHCLSRKQDLCTNRDKYSISPIHEKVINELCHAHS